MRVHVFTEKFLTADFVSKNKNLGFCFANNKN